MRVKNKQSDIPGLRFLYIALSDGVLGFIHLTLFTQHVFQMVLFEIIQTYPSGHAT